MSADDRNGAAIQFVEMSEEIKGQGRGLPVETMAEGLCQQAINPGDDLPGAPVAAAKKQQFGPEPVFVAH